MSNKSYFASKRNAIRTEKPKKVSTRSLIELETGIKNEVKRNSEKLNLSFDKTSERFFD